MPTTPTAAIRRQEAQLPRGSTPASRTLPAGHLACRAVVGFLVFTALVSLLVTAFEVGR